MFNHQHNKWKNIAKPLAEFLGVLYADHVRFHLRESTDAKANLQHCAMNGTVYSCTLSTLEEKQLLSPFLSRDLKVQNCIYMERESLGICNLPHSVDEC